jgi:putative ABC transport system permease protein
MGWNAFLLALREIRKNALRSFLTVLGIVIGVAAVIIMVTIGSGATAKVTQDIEKLGSNLLMIRPGQHRGPGGGPSEAAPFTVKDATVISHEVGSLSAVAPSSSKNVTAVFSNINRSVMVTGTNNDFLIARNWDLALGRSFSEGELKAGRSVCIIGETVKKELFGAQAPIGATIRLNNIACEVIGLLTQKGQSGFGTDQDDLVIIPLRTLQRRLTGNTDIGMIQVSVKKGGSTEKAQSDITRLLREIRQIGPDKSNDFTIIDMKEIANTLSGTTRVLTALLGAVAAVSLLVGGIGIMNIMLVSVTERTREIGTRLAIGALERDVLTQFLVEAVVLSSFGGIFGILIAIVSSIGLCRMLLVPYVFNPMIIFVAFFFSAAVGVLFGYFPARKAARLDPIDALRYE